MQPTAPRPALTGVPSEVLCAQDYEGRLAPAFIAPPTLAYIAGGSGADRTVAANRRAFDDWAIVPRLLADVRGGHTRLTLHGEAFDHPLMLAATAAHRLVHPEGERATALGAAAADACMVCSTQSSITLEAIAKATLAPKWFQIYLQPRREATLDLVKRAEAAGYRALVLTLDAALQAASHRALRAGFCWPDDVQPVNLAGHEAPSDETTPPAGSIFEAIMRHAPRWDDIDWLCSHTRLPVWAKGVLHPQDAQALCKRGVAGVIVSNHGGRSLDGAPASLRMLPAVRHAVGENVSVLFDGGLRSGADAFKALALGADAVMFGRLPLYALAAAGALGVAHLFKLLREELELCMASAGCATLADIGPDRLVQHPADRDGASDRPAPPPSSC